jgi:hypothetical protein
LTRKQRIAQFISSHPHAKYSEWVQFQNTVPEIRLKKVGRGVVQINLDGHSGFIDPESWFYNHKAGQKVAIKQALENSVGVLTKEELLELFEAFIGSTSSGHDVEDDPAELAQSYEKRLVIALKYLRQHDYKLVLQTGLILAAFLKTGKMIDNPSEASLIVG